MRFRDLLPLSFNALLVNKSRTALTMLGIVIGIMSVILMIGVGQAAQRYLLSQVASFGSDLIFVANGRGDETRGGPPSVIQKQTLTYRDYTELSNLTWPKAVNAVVITRDLVSYAGEDMLTQISGSTPGELTVFNEVVDHGRYLNSDDIDSRARVVVLGSKIAERLFGEEEPLSKTIKISKRSFKVIGILEQAGTRFFSDADSQVYIPLTTAMDLYNKTKVNFIGVKSGDVRPNEAKELIRILIRENHNLDNPEGILAKDDFRVAGQEDAVRNADTIGTILQILLGSIASISLVVAGVGIMNIMYVTVTERTREIGLRKAIGARRADVLRQFLTEAVMLTLVAGVIGAILGISLSWTAIQVISRFQDGWTFTVPWFGVYLSFGVSMAIGVIFGFFPARKAANLHPIEALRYE